MSRRPLHLRRTVPLLGAAALLTLAGCSGSGGDAGASDAADTGDRPAVAQRPADEGGPDLLRNDTRSFAAAGRAASSVKESADQSEGADDTVTGPAVISTGVVSLRSRDVAAIAFDVQRILAEHEGTVDDEKTETDSEGTVQRSRLVLRVPSGEFADTMDALEKVGTLQSSSRKSEDVTTQVIDNAVRIRAQEESLRRIEALLARAKNIRTIISIEAQLSQRQADLDSLKSTQAYLKDQTSMSTVTVLMERTPKTTHTVRTEPEKAGFLTGLGDGWDALTGVAAALALLLGRLLPFLVVLALVGIPGWLTWRRQRRRTLPEPAPVE